MHCDLDPMKVSRPLQHISRLLIFAVFSFTTSSFLFGCDNKGVQEAQFIQHAKSKLSEPGDWAKVSTFYDAPWSQVCFFPSMSIHGHIEPRLLSEKFKIEIDAISFPQGLPSSNASHWLILFYTPPNEIYAFRVANEVILGGFHVDNPSEPYPRCVERGHAIFFSVEEDTAGHTYRKLLLSEESRLTVLEQIYRKKKENGR